MALSEIPLSDIESELARRRQIKITEWHAQIDDHRAAIVALEQQITRLRMILPEK